jgi:CTP:phosphocholine cytidylyltransferase-like protein
LICGKSKFVTEVICKTQKRNSIYAPFFFETPRDEKVTKPIKMEIIKQSNCKRYYLRKTENPSEFTLFYK